MTLPKDPVMCLSVVNMALRDSADSIEELCAGWDIEWQELVSRLAAAGFEYDEELGDPDNGIAPGTKFEDLPDDYACPLCGVGKDSFSAQ